MIRVDGLTYAYPGAAEPALRDLSLSIADGETVVIAGDSGSGKSTLARALTGLVPHFHGGEIAGSVVVAGRDTRTHPPRDLADVIGFVAQDPDSQAVADRVEDELAFTMENLGVAPVLMRKRLEEVLDALDLAPLRVRALDTLSGGERQRVAIASVLAAHPRCIVLDEPTSQLDPQSAEDVLGALHRLNADLGLTIVLVEHRLERVLQFADRLIVMREGRVAEAGAPREVLARVEVGPPLARLARELAWEPMPLTVREGRAFASRVKMSPVARPGPTAGGALVEAKGLRVALGGREVLRGVDVTVGRGETLAIVGRNGSGKTTLLRALMGLLRPHAGTRTLAGLDPERTPLEALARAVAYVPQSADSILFCDTVREEIAFTLGARAGAGRVQEHLARAGLDEFASHDPRELSAGERLRTAIAAATAGDPQVVLLDEPTRGMDERGKRGLAQQMRAWRDAGCATVVVTHDVELIASIATRVLLLAGGEVVLDGPVRDVLGESALFSSQMNKVFGMRDVLTVEDALEAVR